MRWRDKSSQFFQRLAHRSAVESIMGCGVLHTWTMHECLGTWRIRSRRTCAALSTPTDCALVNIVTFVFFWVSKV